ncbi:TonB-dependent receptor [Stenotrophomonas sp. MMGLT7]|uniref:TonB-dependent siderophore receptor n=1 Tax=Stenotrophomonas sp. MMGLT7 TaxID=2901227 RepID=UPI001E36402C|nr:TonB-dependent receptor [Stenotrophomonas sp. MMGLT7]MCD7099212.1 TonB-dependent receptor [Stenotrophomonas sp. MMGLT7]
MFSTHCPITGRAPLSLLCAALFAAMLQPARAQTSAVAPVVAEAGNDYAIPAGPLATTLKEIARISGRPVRFEARDVQGQQAPALVGRRNAVAAVQEVIAGSRLTMTSNASGELVVFVPQLDTLHVVATRDEAETGFKASSSDTATRSGSDLLDVPQSVTVITAKVIETQQAQSVQDVLQNVSGVVTRESAQGLPSYSIRGFTQTSTLSNGVTNPYSGTVNIANVERVEVLKGPQAILSGGESLGGAVNIVTKKPSAETIRDLSLQYGSHADKSGSLDLSGAVTDDKRLSYRLIGSSARADRNDAGFDGRESDSVLAELRWKDEATDALVGLSYDNQYSPQNRYTFGLAGIQPIPSMRLGAATDGMRVRNKALFYSVEHAFAPWLTLVSRMQRTLSTQDLQIYTPQFPQSTADMIISMAPGSTVSDFRTTSGDHYLRMTFDTGPFAHKLSTGFNHTRMASNVVSYSGSNIPVPVYQAEQYDFVALPRNADTLYSYYDSTTQQYALFAQDLISFGDWHALLGVRRTRYESGPASTGYVQSGRTTLTIKSRMEQTTPNVGLVYNLTSNVSLYASYAEGFLPQFVTVKNCGTGGNGDFPPMETNNKEAGIKVNSRDGAFAWTSAVYQLDQSNTLQYDSAGACYDVREAKRVRGFETEAAGQLLPGLNLIFNYTYAKSEDTGNSTTLYAAEPRHQASVWSTYDFQSGGLQGFGVSLGVTGYSWTRLGTTSASVVAPGAARVDAGISYQQPDWSLRLGVKNLFDRQLYGYSASTMYVPVQEGRTVALTWRKSF